MFDSFVFLPLSTRAYFKGRAYIKIILKNHARSYFAGRSYYRGNTLTLPNWCLPQYLRNYCGLTPDFIKLSGLRPFFFFFFGLHL